MRYWNKALTLTTGCSKISEACKFCWAETNHNRFMRRANKKYDHDFSEVRVHPENIGIIDKSRKPKTFSVWNDACHNAVTDTVLDLLFEAINRNPQHTYLICTKRPERMAKYFNRAENYKFIAHTHKIFLGTTVESPDVLWRIGELLKCKPFELFLSVEPMLSNIKIPQEQLKQIDYVIAGCESGHHSRETKTAWVEDLMGQCLDANTLLWVKQLKINGKMVYEHSLSTIKREDLWENQ